MKTESKQDKIPDMGGYSMFIFYTKKLMDKNPSYKSYRDTRLKVKGVRTIYKVVSYVKTFIMDYALFSKVIASFNKKAALAITSGERIRMGHGLGYLEARRVERNLARPKVDVISTVKARKETGDSSLVIYYTDEDYCRIAWKKTGNVTNCYIYEFKAAWDFRKQFSAALRANKGLKYLYPYSEFDAGSNIPDLDKKIATKIRVRNQYKNAA